MFTGIIGAVSAVTRVEKRVPGVRIFVKKPRGWRVPLGGSIAVDGICLTSVGAGSNLEFDVMDETLAKTIAGMYQKGSRVNLERPLRIGDELGGHFVLGHVDSRAAVTSVKERGSSREVTIRIPAPDARLVARVGSVAINGVSLTVAKKTRYSVTVSLVAHTLRSTNLSNLKPDDVVNVEYDVLARYLAALAER